MEEEYKRSDIEAESSSIGSSSSLDMADHEEEEEEEEVSSSSSSEGPLYELSDLMAQLPIKRGLSKFYDGKSESYTSLMGVRSVEDLLKKKERSPFYSNNNNKRRLLNKKLSCNGSKKVLCPKATISKKMKQCRRDPANSIATTNRPPFHALF